MLMPFGKYRGTLIEDIPTDYLEWVVEVIDSHNPRLLEAIKDELSMRHASSETSRPVETWTVRRIIEVGRRALAKKYHPDYGGNHEQMVALNNAGDWLLRQTLQLE